MFLSCDQWQDREMGGRNGVASGEMAYMPSQNDNIDASVTRIKTNEIG
jgi:hypothetical protein